MLYVPSVVEQTPRGERSWDLFSRLLQSRIIFIGSEINDMVASLVIGQLFYLQGEDPGKDIDMYINTLGGEVPSAEADVAAALLWPAADYALPTLHADWHVEAYTAAFF